MKPLRSRTLFLPLVLVASAGLAAACGSKSETTSEFGDGTDAGDGDATLSGAQDSGGDDASGFGSVGGDASFDTAQFTLSPSKTTLDVHVGAAAPSVQFSATYKGAPITASYRITDRGELASIDATSGLFKPIGGLGGTVTVAADYHGYSATASVLVKRHVVQNGDPSAATSATDGGAGSGGYGGVGGDGSGAAITSAQQTILDAAGMPGTGGDGASWLYPYDATVFPRGIVPPLLQWAPGTSGDYDALKIHLQEGNLEYTGYFSKPANATVFQNHPILPAAWNQIYSSYTSATGGENLSVTVTLLPHNGTTAFALPTRSWKIAGGSLRGKIYYQSYGTRLATQAFTDIKGEAFGGATLAIQPGATAPDPTPAAGGTTTNNDGCRVCHSVAANGSALVTQSGTVYGTSDLVNLIDKSEVLAGENNQFPALSPDGKIMLTNAAPGIQTVTPTQSGFYSIPGGLQVPLAGIPANWKAYFPTFSGDGKQIAYDDGNTSTLTVVPVDLKKATFGTETPVFTPPSGQHAYWPSFTPTSDGLVFEVEILYNGRDVAGTRSTCDDVHDTNHCSDQGAHAELWYVNTKTGKSHRLDNANGNGYLPTHASAYVAHDSDGGVTDGGVDDTGKDPEFNYEPTVNPVVSGGYAWMVFTSRRVYGNVATINPFHSDPRFEDITVTPTTKKLWVAAVDLSGDGTIDPSHPAFYLPGQEILAGNSRGYWVVDPCAADGVSCETGDQCCGGYCQASNAGGDGGALTCGSVKPVCALQFDKCTIDGDCCDPSLACISSRCSVPTQR